MSKNLTEILKFKGEWRTYQARVLSRTDKYLQDGRVHIVAAPGSGKTTLGIELIGRLDRPTLILAPTITIREQWISRIKEGFLTEGESAEDHLSQDLRTPKAITVATYQALYRAMTKAKGRTAEELPEAAAEDGQYELSESGAPESETDVYAKADRENLDYSDFEMIKTARAFGFGVICLDECHHLRNEWWRALEEFKKAIGEIKVIALTATPPYDSTPALWSRYINMCGEIDEEITVPELVKEGSLCPHQDYVFFNYPTSAEQKLLDQYEKRAKEIMDTLMKDEEFARCVRSHPALLNMKSADELLDNPARLSAILIFLKAKGIPFPPVLQKLLGANKLPAMELKWMEVLLQNILYDDKDSFFAEKTYLEGLENKLKQRGLIERRTVCLTDSTKMKKTLSYSLGKCESIKRIAAHEYAAMGKGLHLLILTDYIRKQYEAALGDDTMDVTAMGVLPFFEQLRRAGIGSSGPEGEMRLGVLCGSMVIIPAEAQNVLLDIIETEGRVSFSAVGQLSPEDYVKVSAVGDSHFLTAAVTELFSQGYIQALVGTKSLLGEGWDSPCINSLILASFVGSFMLSNQMRGRAIRVDRNNPDKTSNIWHLVCLKPVKEQQKDGSGYDYGEDLKVLMRRMEHFLGLDYEEDYIETGMGRLKIIKAPFTAANIQKMNKAMLELSGQRQNLKARWDRSLEVINGFEIADEVGVNDSFLRISGFFDAILARIVVALLILATFFRLISIFDNLMIKVPAFVLFLACMGLSDAPGLLHLLTPLRRLKAFGSCIHKALLDGGHYESDKSRVAYDSPLPGYHFIYLKGGTGRDKALFSKCINEFFDDIDNQRYILVKRRFRKSLSGFFAVPELFARRKEDAQLLASGMKKYVGKYDAVYTRSVEGRKLLLAGRRYALANRESAALLRKKRVKSSLE